MEKFVQTNAEGVEQQSPGLRSTSRVLKMTPLKQFVKLARQRNIVTIVDGAQAVGMFPVDLQNLGCDAYAASLHKWVLGPMGTGVLYIKKEARDKIHSVFSAESISENLSYSPIGTTDLPVKAGILAALGFITKIVLKLIEKRDRFLSTYLKSRLGEIPSVQLVSGPTEQTSAPGSTIFEMEGLDALGAVTAFAQNGIHIDEHTRDGHNAIRVSTHFYNTRKNIDDFIAALTKMQ